VGSSLRIPPIQDIARLLRPSHADTVVALRDYYDGSGIFNYKIAQKIARHILSHAIPLKDGLKACEAHWHAGARVQNGQVICALWEAGNNRIISPYEVAPKIIGIRRDLQIRVAPTFGFVERGSASLFWLQPRRRFALSLNQLGFLASVIRRTYLVDDFAEVGLEVFDLSVPEGQADRVPTRYSLADLPALPNAEVQDCLIRFVLAYEALVQSGVTRKVRKPAKRDPRPPDLLD
jgi:hypothetical protein